MGENDLRLRLEGGARLSQHEFIFLLAEVDRTLLQWPSIFLLRKAHSPRGRHGRSGSRRHIGSGHQWAGVASLPSQDLDHASSLITRARWTARAQWPRPSPAADEEDEGTECAFLSVGLGTLLVISRRPIWQADAHICGSAVAPPVSVTLPGSPFDHNGGTDTLSLKSRKEQRHAGFPPYPLRTFLLLVFRLNPHLDEGAAVNVLFESLMHFLMRVSTRDPHLLLLWCGWRRGEDGRRWALPRPRIWASAHRHSRRANPGALERANCFPSKHDDLEREGPLFPGGD
jgi:hypothetical protein